MAAVSSLLLQHGKNKIGDDADLMHQQQFPEELHLPLLFNNEQQNLVVNDGSPEPEERREQQRPDNRANHDSATDNSWNRTRRSQTQVFDNEQVFGIYVNPLAFLLQ